MLPVVPAPYHEANDVADGTGTRGITDATLVGELSQKDDNDGRKAQFPVVSAAIGATIEVTEQFGSVIKVGDKITTVTKGANNYTIQASTATCPCLGLVSPTGSWCSCGQQDTDA